MQPGLARSLGPKAKGGVLSPGIGSAGSELIARDNGHLVDKNCKREALR